MRIWVFPVVVAVLALVGPAAANTAGLMPVTFDSEDARSHTVTIAGSRIEVYFDDLAFNEQRQRFLDWIGASAQAVTHYYGRFPVDRVSLSLIGHNGGGVSGGRQFSGNLPVLNVTVGTLASEEELRDDWIMVHEMVHLALADLPQKNRWLEEGLAVYVESVARAQVGHLDEDFVWRGFLRSMHQGMPKSGDRGLDRTPTWGRTYWGGAIFCLLADIEIRQRTDNRHSLRDALRGIVNAGMTTRVDGFAEPVLAVGDAAVGVDVLVPMYRKMSEDPTTPSLDTLWKKLGVALEGHDVVYDDTAALAHIRQALLR